MSYTRAAADTTAHLVGGSGST